MVENYNDNKRLAAVIWNVNFVGGFDYSHRNESKVKEKHKGKGNALDALCTLRNFSNSLITLYFENITHIQRNKWSGFLKTGQSDLDDHGTNDSNAMESGLHYIYFYFIFFGWTAYATSNRTAGKYTSDHPQQSNKYLVCQSLQCHLFSEAL